MTALLRWPTAPPGMEMPVVEVHKHGVWLLAKNVDQYIHRILVEEDALKKDEGEYALFTASLRLALSFIRGVGLFPDVLERKVWRHFDDGDQISALVTGEFYTKKDLFPGFARPYVFNSMILLRVGRATEAKDAARVALKSPWWTLGCPYELFRQPSSFNFPPSRLLLNCFRMKYSILLSRKLLLVMTTHIDQEVADMAHWEDEQIEFIKEKVTEEGRQEDLKKGKEPIQVALDEAAFLLDLASVEGSWDECLARVAECYKEAGLDDIAKFVLYRD
ncbi:ATP synthase subunit alpha [Bienertia sinuspersici]